MISVPQLKCTPNPSDRTSRFASDALDELSLILTSIKGVLAVSPRQTLVDGFCRALQECFLARADASRMTLAGAERVIVAAYLSALRHSSRLFGNPARVNVCCCSAFSSGHHRLPSRAQRVAQIHISSPCFATITTLTSTHPPTISPPMAETATEHRPPSPIQRSDTPNGGTGFFSVPFERWVKDDLSDFASGFTLLGA